MSDLAPRSAVHSSGPICINSFSPAAGDVLRVGSTRRGFLQTGLAGLAGLSLPALLQQHARAAAAGKAKSKTNVILFWLSGGPSHLDMWDPKPDAPREIRGPFGHIPTKLPGVHVCEHLPLTARLMDKLTLIRSVDCSASDHTPITMQAGNPLARRTNDGKDGGGLSLDGIDRGEVPRRECAGICPASSRWRLP